jgi:hypothetical protein
MYMHLLGSENRQAASQAKPPARRSMVDHRSGKLNIWCGKALLSGLFASPGTPLLNRFAQVASISKGMTSTGLEFQSQTCPRVAEPSALEVCGHERSPRTEIGGYPSGSAICPTCRDACRTMLPSNPPRTHNHPHFRSPGASFGPGVSGPLNAETASLDAVR